MLDSGNEVIMQDQQADSLFRGASVNEITVSMTIHEIYPKNG